MKATFALMRAREARLDPETASSKLSPEPKMNLDKSLEAWRVTEAQPAHLQQAAPGANPR